MSVPEITEIQQLLLEPGDRLVVSVKATWVTQQDAEEIKNRVRTALHISDDVHIAILAGGTRISVVSAEASLEQA